MPVFCQVNNTTQARNTFTKNNVKLGNEGWGDFIFGDFNFRGYRILLYLFSVFESVSSRTGGVELKGITAGCGFCRR